MKSICDNIEKNKTIFFAIIAIVAAISVIAIAQNCFSEDAQASEISEDGSVTVYLTIQNDGDFVTANDTAKTTMAHVEMEVPYFSLEKYELSDFTKSDSVGEGKPTVLHAYIQALETYYLGGGTFVNGDSSGALKASGGAGSMFMETFWNHDLNLMYFINYKFPLQSDPECGKTGSTLGATADDYILTDGMVIEVGMFTDWEFYTKGYFTSITPDTLKADVDSKVTLTLRGVSTSMTSKTQAYEIYDVQSVNSYVFMDNQHLTVSKSPADINTRTEFSPEVITDSEGKATISFSEPGRYYVSAIIDYKDATSQGEHAAATSPLTIIEVTEKGSSGSSSALYIAIAIIVAVVLVGAAVFIIRGRQSKSQGQ